MELTKYDHACALLTKDNHALLIDPGGWTDLPDDLPQIDVLIITHAHPDHFDTDKVAKIIAGNPNIQIFGAPEVASKITQPHVTVPVAGDEAEAAGFKLQFYGGQHAVIHDSMPPIGNLGVAVDGQVYYPGDSFADGPKSIAVLLAPVAAPWMTIGEGIDFIIKQEAKLVIPTHDGFLADNGKQMHDSMLSGAAEKAGGDYKRLQAGETVTV